MGESGDCVEPIGLMPNGLSPDAGPMLPVIDSERWRNAEERTAELIACIQPNPPSEKRRTAVADYVQRLIVKCFPCQVFTFGSVPLKTYLPDGDIDLTAFSNNQSLKDSWAVQVRDMLEKEEKDENAEFRVKEVQYIQAEVKIIKCLVDNIVVDISFNQLGGLCTLCFLEEVDNLISQDHLFKRSVILIKAWCYYESRILGAHHGLISTYALETLVLYIFHVFNNSFAGPLEVLYRFLEFFSNFDWDNFCVSLWGPVPINSLPDVTAEPPRKDGGELLLSKLFLDACSSVYAVFPGGQETYGQPFVSKHFNVIDPLRVNNNLGRSVSKGNFYRIRSAFSLGAKRLARLLDCPKENLVSEVNQFFMNTWVRHGSGNLQDATGTNLLQLKLSSAHLLLKTGDSQSKSIGRNANDNSSDHEAQNNGNRNRYGSSQGNNYSSGSPSRVVEPSHAQSQRSLGNVGTFRDQTVREDNFSQGVLPNGSLRHLKSEVLPKDAHGRFIFARTHSSPELTDSYGDTASHGKPGRTAENSKVQASFTKVENSNRKKLGSENGTMYSSRSLKDGSTSVRSVPSTQDLDPAGSDSGSNYHQKSGLDGPNEEVSSAASISGMLQEEQDLVNIMSSANLNGFSGQVPVPFNLASTRLPFQISPFLASMGYNQRNMPAMVPPNVPLVDPSFADLKFPHGLVTSPLTSYFPGYAMSSTSEDGAEQSNDNFGPRKMNPGDFENEHWQEHHAGRTGSINLGNRNHERRLENDKLQKKASDIDLVAPSWVSSSGRSFKEQKHATDRHGSVLEADNLQLQDDRGGEYYVDERALSSRFSSAAHINSLRSKTSSESSWDGSSKSTKAKGGETGLSAEPAITYGEGKLISLTVPNQTEVDEREWNSEITSRSTGPETVTSFPGFRNSYHEASQLSSSDSSLPIAPMLIGPDSQQRMPDNSGLVAFYPTGPPIPFLTMLPVYNVPHETGNSDASTNHFARVEALGNTDSGPNIYSPAGTGQSEDLSTSSSLRGMNTVVIPKEAKSDILNSDFASHWQNLQFGRFCQNPPNENGPPMYPSPLMVPPVYLQGGFPLDGSGRPLSANMNIVSQLIGYGPRLSPVSPVHSASAGPPNVYQCYVDEIPRQRSGTGTYLPNPKISTRERHYSGTRRGSFNYSRNDNHGDREGNWNVNAKTRVAPSSQNRGQTEKQNSRLDQLPSEGRADRAWSSHRHDSHPSYQSQNGPLRSNPSSNGPTNLAYGMYSLPAMRSNGAPPSSPNAPPVMVYPVHQNSNVGSHGEQLEFGSLGSVGYSGTQDQSQLNEGSRLRGSFNDPRFRGRSDHQSSPDQPSSPHHRRRV